MKVSYNWLQTYFDEPLPSPEDIADALTMHAFEIESVEKVGEDTVIDIDVLPNRAHDCLCHAGIAREVNVLLGVPLKALSRTTNDLPVSKILSVDIEDTTQCRRYSGAVLEGVTVGSSPAWLKERLEALGQRSINNVVDATNYVMLSTGQPLHAFDRDKMASQDGGYKIVVGTLGQPEVMTALDEVDYTLEAGDLLIRDGHANTTLGIAGIKGGMIARVDESTTTIILESANFEPVKVRTTSQRLKLRTDASQRFEQEITPEKTIEALYDVIDLIKEIAGGALEGGIDIYPRTRGAYKVGVSRDEINRLLGTALTDDDIEDILDRLNVTYGTVDPVRVALVTAKALIGKPYQLGASVSYDTPFRFDCSSLAAYCYAEGGIGLPRISVDQYVWGDPVEEKDIQPGDLVFSNTREGTIHYETKEFMKGARVDKGVDHVGIYMGEGNVLHATRTAGKVILEPLATAAQFKHIVGYRRVANDMRRYVVMTPAERLDLRIKEDLIEEIGRVYGYTKITRRHPHKEVDPPVVNPTFFGAQRLRDALVRRGFSEVMTYSFRSEGEVEMANPIAQGKEYLRTNLRNGVGEALEHNGRYSDLLGLDVIKIFEIGTVFANGQEYLSLAVGVVSPKVKPTKRQDDAIVHEAIADLADELGIEIAIEPHIKNGIFETKLEHVIKKLVVPHGTEVREVHFEDQPEVRYNKISPYPFVLRDIALWVPDDTTLDDITAMIAHEAGELLVRTTLFDEFSKDGRVSYAFRLVFLSDEKTLTDEEVNEVMKKVTTSLNGVSGWEVR